MVNTRSKVLAGAVLGLLLSVGLAMPASAQGKLDKNQSPATTTSSSAGIDFGSNTSRYADDGECDDPRFAGPGMAVETWGENEGHDAADCRAAFGAGTISEIPADAAVDPATAAAAIDFGDDSSVWANDGECDDPRFSGPGMAVELEDVDIARDATDCRTLFEAGSLNFRGEPQAAEDIDYGDDTSEWALDDECDDPRFSGSTMSVELEAVDMGHDATDCRAGIESGALSYVGEQTSIDFGDDASRWANDGECDDPRFSGPGMAAELEQVDSGHDAADCRALFLEGLTFRGQEVTQADIDYGNDSSDWANDDECDDPRFSGSAVAADPLTENIGRDATDCRNAVENGSATYIGEEGAPAVATFDYGNDTSKWANDGECDDPRFAGPGTAKKLLDADEYGDATDCRTLVEAGEVRIIPVYTPEFAAAAPYDPGNIAFGDDSSTYANDEVCDDPRFVGPGAATVLFEEDIERDAADCEAAYRAGRIMLVEDV